MHGGRKKKEGCEERALIQRPAILVPLACSTWVSVRERFLVKV